MARICGKCHGSGWFGPRTDLGRPLGVRGGGPCRACNGTGYDNRWGEKSCRGCSATIEYRYDWSNVPDYCQNCRQDQFKSCANPHCNGTVKYKVFWDHIPDYCSCKGWYEKPCENPHCHGTIHANCSWSNVPKYCKDCKGFYEVTCQNTHCSKTIRVHCEWSNIPKYCDCKGWYTSNCGNPRCSNKVENHFEKRQKDYCKACFDLLHRRTIDEICRGTTIGGYIGNSTGSNIKDCGDYWHVTLFTDSARVSSDINKLTSEETNYHFTLYNYDEKGKRGPSKYDMHVTRED